MTTAKKITTISRTYSDLRNIESAQDLRHAGLSLSDYHAAIAIFPEVSRPGTSASTIIQNVATFFKDHGYTVTAGTIGFNISI